MNLETTLHSLPPSHWVAECVIVFDWYDGPRQGVARFSKPSCEFAFDLVAERPDPDGLDDRLFRLSELPAGSVARVEAALPTVSRAAGPVWVPEWRFDGDERAGAERAVGAATAAARVTQLVIRSTDFRTFTELARLDRSGSLPDRLAGFERAEPAASRPTP